METILTILGIFNLVISIFSALCFGMSFNDSNYTYKDICTMYLFDCLLFPVYVYREFNESYNIIGSLIMAMLLMFIWVGVACGSSLIWILRTAVEIFNCLFKKKET